MAILEEPKDANDQKNDQKQRDRPRRQGRQQHHHHAHRAPDPFWEKHKTLQWWMYTYDTAVRACQYAKATEAITDWVKV